MAHVDKYFCDYCKKEIYMMECHTDQLMYAIHECFDDGQKYDFCSLKCLYKFARELLEKANGR